MIETVALYAGYSLLAVYFSLTAILMMAFLNEGRPLSHIVYVPLVFLWPIGLVKILWSLRHGKNWECGGPKQ